MKASAFKSLTLTHIYILAMFISGVFTFAGFCEVNDAQESSMKSGTWSRWRHERVEHF